METFEVCDKCIETLKNLKKCRKRGYIMHEVLDLKCLCKNNPQFFESLLKIHGGSYDAYVEKVNVLVDILLESLLDRHGGCPDEDDKEAEYLQKQMAHLEYFRNGVIVKHCIDTGIL